MRELKDFQELYESNELCKYCRYTDYGDVEGPIGYGTPNGYVGCEDDGCEDAFNTYLDSLGLNKHIYDIATKVKMIKDDEVSINE